MRRTVLTAHRRHELPDRMNHLNVAGLLLSQLTADSADNLRVDLVCVVGIVLISSA